MTKTNENIYNIYVPLVKSIKQKYFEGPEGQIIVKGVGTSESIDNDGDILEYTSTKKAIQTWVEKCNGVGNLRGQHNPKWLVGIIPDIQFDDVNKLVKLETEVLDPLAKEYTLKGAFNGFSIGVGEYTTKMLGNGARMVYPSRVFEFSLVDQPCNHDSVVETKMVLGKVLGDTIEKCTILHKGKEIKNMTDVNEEDKSELNKGLDASDGSKTDIEDPTKVIAPESDPTLNGDESGHQKPFDQVLAGLRALIVQEAGEVLQGESPGGLNNLTNLLSQMLAWGAQENYDDVMGVTVDTWDLFYADTAKLTKSDKPKGEIITELKAGIDKMSEVVKAISEKKDKVEKTTKAELDKVTLVSTVKDVVETPVVTEPLVEKVLSDDMKEILEKVYGLSPKEIEEKVETPTLEKVSELNKLMKTKDVEIDTLKTDLEKALKEVERLGVLPNPMDLVIRGAIPIVKVETNNIESSAYLKEMAYSDPDPEIRKAARNKLKDL